MPNNHQPGTAALRLTFSYEGSAVQLLTQQSLEMRIPPSDSLEDFTGQAGFWYELRDTNAQSVYRRITANPIQFSIEGPADDEEDLSSIQRVTVDNPQGVFMLLVPNFADAQTLVLVSSPLDPQAFAEPATELAVFDLSGGIV